MELLGRISGGGADPDCGGRPPAESDSGVFPSDFRQAGPFGRAGGAGESRLLLPQILRDFPDFDLRQAKEAAKAYLRENLAGKAELRIHNVVLSQYFPALVEKTLVFQAAVSFREGGATVQKRYDLSYAYRLPGGAGANCPNCGGVLAPGQLQCAYCGAWVANPMGAVWSFTRMEET